MKMYLTTFFVLLVTALTVNSEKHSLKYIYTALSKPVGLPGIHQFTAMGLMDGRMIDYYDSGIQRKVPKQDWMKDQLPADHWENGTLSHQSKHQWFKDNIDILMKRMNQTNDDLHVFQGMHGCEGETTGPNGTLKFVRGVDKYNYDGQDFLSFDNANSSWVAATEEAFHIKIKWDHDQDLIKKTKGYLEIECIDWLDKFMKYGEKQLEAASPPDVYVLTKKTRIESNLTLTCLATGFYTKEIILIIRRNGRIMTEEDRLISSGVQPNGDDTFQRRDHVEILKSDNSIFTCEFIHIASSVFVEKPWDHKVTDGENNAGIIGGVIGGLIVVVLLVLVRGAVVLVVLMIRRRRREIIHQEVMEGKLAYLSCPHSVEGKVTWSREINGRKVDIFATDGDRNHDPQRRYGSTVDKSLIITRLFVSDSGTYYCNNEPAAELTVIPSGTKILQTTERSNITLTCPHDDGGSHVPTWSREIGGKQEPIRLHVSTGTKTLMFPNLQPADSGLYLCDGKPAVYLNVIKGSRTYSGSRPSVHIEESYTPTVEVVPLDTAQPAEGDVKEISNDEDVTKPLLGIERNRKGSRPSVHIEESYTPTVEVVPLAPIPSTDTAAVRRSLMPRSQSDIARR